MKIRNIILLLLLLFACSQKLIPSPVWAQMNEGQLVTSLTKVFLPEYPDAHNPSLIETEQGLLLTFRWLPSLEKTPWISYIGVVFLNESFQPISKPQLLNTRVGNTTVPSQSEDARIFTYQGNLYLIYNDNVAITNPSAQQRRDIYIAQLSYENGQFIVSQPIKLFHQQKYHSQKWQKNWVPFEWHNALLFSYSLIPHEVLFPDLESQNGESIPFVTTPLSHPTWEWKWGHLRGGTPALLIDNEYLAFFHSSNVTSSASSGGVPMHHYYLGAYTFAQEPPFALTSITPSPIIADGFYTQSSAPKRVIFPGGFVMRDHHIYLAYGKDDQEIWIATLNRDKLQQALVPVSSLDQANPEAQKLLGTFK